jgi:hypothetical protein
VPGVEIDCEGGDTEGSEDLGGGNRHGKAARGYIVLLKVKCHTIL